MITLSCLALVALLTTAAWATPLLARPTLPFGVRVPGDRATDPAVTAQRRRYTRAVVILGGLAALACLPAAALRGTPDVLPAIVALLGAADAMAFYTAHRAVATAKRRGSWYAGTRQAVTTDTSFRTDPVRPPWPLLVPSLLLFLVTAATGAMRYGDLPATLATLRGIGVDPANRVATTPATAFAPVLSQAAITLIAPLALTALLRARPDLDAAHPVSSARRYRVYLRGIAALLAAGAACVNLTLLLLALRLWEILTPSPVLTVATWAPPAAAVIAFLIFGVRVGEAGHRLPPAPGEPEPSGFVQRDDDRHWHFAGTVYANRRDPAILVHQRVGGRWTLNLANPVAWAVVGVAAVLTLLSLFSR